MNKISWTRYLVLLILFVSITSDLSAQRRRRHRTTWNNNMDKFELVGGMGLTQFLGDVGGADDIGTNFLADFDFDALRPNFYLGFRYRYNEFLASRVHLTYGILKGSDQYTDELPRQTRNLSFRSPLIEWGTTLEFYFLPDVPTKNRYRSRGLYGRKGRPVTGYISTGIVGFWFDPVADDASGREVRLQPLGTEGQGIVPTRNPYSLVEIGIPINLGFNFKINTAISIEVELCYRKTFTDYMDDVSMTYIDPSVFTDPNAAYFHSGTSLNLIPGANAPGQQRGDPTDNDDYLFMHVGVAWKLFSVKTSLPKYR
jgi:hypothetical protein